MKVDKSTERKAAEVAGRLADEVKAEGEATDQYVGRSPEKQEELDGAAVAAGARHADAQSSTSEREFELEKELRDLQAEKARLEAAKVDIETKTQAWMSGDFSKYPTDYPFAVTIFSSSNMASDLPVPIAINGYTTWVPRNQRVTLTRAQVEVLEHAEVNSPQQPLVIDGESVPTHVHRKRHQFTATPIGG